LDERTLKCVCCTPICLSNLRYYTPKIHNDFPMHAIINTDSFLHSPLGMHDVKHHRETSNRGKTEYITEYPFCKFKILTAILSFCVERKSDMYDMAKARRLWHVRETCPLSSLCFTRQRSDEHGYQVQDTGSNHV
ncbi:hypothetical protein L9F63_011498, partial [Diploptera punctata]